MSSAVPARSSALTTAIGQRLIQIREEIAKTSQQKGKKPPLLVCASKTKSVDSILQAYSAPIQPRQLDFGENYVKELLEKAASKELNQDVSKPDHIRWHLIGHLQTNKCKQIARIPNLALVESVDSIKLATELNKACVSVGRATRLPVLIQVNTSGEASKYGCQPNEALELFGHVVENCPQLKAQGLMTIGRLADTPQPDCFQLLAKIKEEIFEVFKGKTDKHATNSSSSASASSPTPLVVDGDTFEMSMGMSGDYDVGIDYGATIVRIGSSIFGAREYPERPPTPEANPNQKEKESNN